MQETRIRKLAQQLLPDFIRKPVGSLIGKILQRIQYPIILPTQGFLFDLFCRGRAKIDGCVFETPKDLTSRLIRGCFFDGSYEISERSVIRQCVRADDTVIELGACLGVVSCTTNKLLRNPAQHVVVEANPKCIPAIERNRDLNQCRFQIKNCAVGNEREVTFFLDPKLIISGTAKSKSAFAIKVRGHSLGELYQENGPFSVLIMDIEGSELDVLESSQELLPKFRVIVIEFHDWIIGTEGVNRCREILQRAGFTLATKAVHNEGWIRA